MLQYFFSILGQGVQERGTWKIWIHFMYDIGIVCSSLKHFLFIPVCFEIETRQGRIEEWQKNSFKEWISLPRIWKVHLWLARLSFKKTAENQKKSRERKSFCFWLDLSSSFEKRNTFSKCTEPNRSSARLQNILRRRNPRPLLFKTWRHWVKKRMFNKTWNI